MIGTIKVKKADLLMKVKRNRAIHEEVHTEAVKGWEVSYREKLKKEIEKKEFKEAMHFPAKPNNYLREYDGAIAQLEMSVDKEIELNQHEFSTLCLDQWQHDRVFVTSSRSFVNVNNLSAGAQDLYNTKLQTY